MSLLINDMNMPKNCAECPILEYGSLEHYCPLAKESMWNIDTESGKHKNCPLSEIRTPHGRLTDADRLIAVLKSTTAISQSDYDLFNHIVGLIEHQPTVIEAEE